MTAPLIPWRAFFKALQKQNSLTLQAWLRRWTFTDAGPALIYDTEKCTAESLALFEEAQKQAVFFLMADNKWLKTQH
jgi:hypothetical protein